MLYLSSDAWIKELNEQFSKYCDEMRATTFTNVSQSTSASTPTSTDGNAGRGHHIEKFIDFANCHAKEAGDILSHVGDKVEGLASRFASKLANTSTEVAGLLKHQPYLIKHNRMSTRYTIVFVLNACTPIELYD